MLKVNDFFCGCGGFGLGFKQSGFRLVGAWDFDRYAVESYGHNVSPKVKQDDITKMNWDEIPHADVWTFGFPCQDISVAGPQKGMVKGETRSGLFYEIMRLLEEIEINDHNRLPSIILAENVKAVYKYLPEIEKEYAARGYKMYTTLYNSKYWGVPQNRERYFIVGVHKSIDKPFVFIEQQTDYIPKLSSVLEDEVDAKYYIDNEKARTILESVNTKLTNIHACSTVNRNSKQQNGRRAKDDEEVMFTLTTNDIHGVIDVIGRLDIKGHDYIKRVYNVGGISPTLTTSGGGSQEPKVLVVGNLKPDHCTRGGQRDDVWDADGVSGALLASDYKQPRPILHNLKIRKLTPREYARLQGFGDDYKQVVSNTQFYKQMGNAVTVTVSRSIAEQIALFLKG